jgi:hypothetical protein
VGMGARLSVRFGDVLRARQRRASGGAEVGVGARVPVRGRHVLWRRWKREPGDSAMVAAAPLRMGCMRLGWDGMHAFGRVEVGAAARLPVG